MEYASESRDKRLEQYGVNGRPVTLTRSSQDSAAPSRRSKARHQAQARQSICPTLIIETASIASCINQRRHPPPQMEPGTNPAVDSAAFNSVSGLVQGMGSDACICMDVLAFVASDTSTRIMIRAQARDDFTQVSAKAVINGASSMPFANIEKLHDADIQISSTEGGIIIHIII